MKKMGVLLFFITIVLINLISAAYKCSNETSMLEDQEEIEVNERKTINGLGVGVIYSDEAKVTGKITAKLLVDTKKVLLSNETFFEDIELLSGDHAVSLINLTDNTAEIKIDGSSKLINKEELDSIADLKVYFVGTEGTDSGGNSIAKVLIGISEIILDNKENSAKIVTINEADYLLELFSASDDNAIIKVKKCKAGKIIEVEEKIVENITEENRTSSDNNTTIEEENETLEIIENDTEKIICEIGIRKNESYCNENKTFVSQKENKSSCSNDYECKTNYCKSEKCAKLGIFKKIVLWFKGLFKKNLQ